MATKPDTPTSTETHTDRPWLERVDRATEARRAAETEWHDAILAAKRAGASTRAIGARAGISHQRVQQIVAGAA
jgi:hypothetical protein